ncbi:MAG: glycosyltransferase family 4 protein [Solirubrobacteraceae bacterium]
MRIALVNDWFLKYVTEQAIGLRRMGCEVLVICRDHLGEFAEDRSEWEALIAKLDDAGVLTSVIRGRTSSWSAAWSGLAARSLLTRWNPDIVHAHPNVDPWLYLATVNSPIVLTVHDPHPHPGQPRYGMFRQAIGDAWRRRTMAFVVHGDALVAELRPMVGSKPIRVIPHGLSPSIAPYPAPARSRLLFFGRLEPYKGISVLVAAMPEVWKVQPDVELVVAGRGPSADQVPDHASIRRMTRYIAEHEVDALLRDSTLVVAPYLEASQSGVVSLAVARGIPVIVSDRGSLPDLAVSPSLIVPAGDPQALAHAVLGHLGHDAELRRRVHELAVHKLSWDATANLALSYYRELLSQ